jgi:hypothetical protein
VICNRRTDFGVLLQPRRSYRSTSMSFVPTSLPQPSSNPEPGGRPDLQAKSARPTSISTPVIQGFDFA